MKERKKKREADGKEKTKAGGRSFGAHALSRSEFLGFIFRLAIERFYNSNEICFPDYAWTRRMPW